MKHKKIFTATEARQNFFELIKLAGQGKEVYIKKDHLLLRIKLEKTGSKQEIQKKLKALNRLSKIGLPSKPINKMKEIYSQKDICIT